ncbi:IS4/Tn5 family transposase DNA-binding protein [Bradyrhizobium sp. USDA 3240]
MGLTSRARDEKAHRLASDVVTWFDREAALCEFQDARLGERFRMLLKQIGGDIGQSIPMVCQDWANTKAAYRFFSNERVGEADILSGHFKATRERIAAAKGPVLVLHDATEFSYQRERPDLIGMIKRIPKKQLSKIGREPPNVHDMRNIDAFEPCGDPRGASTGAQRCEVLDQKEIQRGRCAQARGQPDTDPH